MIRLARATGDDYYLRTHAREPRAASASSSRAHDGDFDAMKGMASERYYQTDCFAAEGHAAARSRTPGATASSSTAARTRWSSACEDASRTGSCWGVATSAYQIEGSPDADGHGPSIWDRLRRRERRHAARSPATTTAAGARTCELMASLGVNAYRFSLAWPRLFPDGRRREQRGFDHYDRLLDALLERGIEPLVTLYHWDLPRALEERAAGATATRPSASPSTPPRASRPTATACRCWVTINEPWIVGLLGYLHGLHAPGVKDDAPRRGDVFHHLLLAHGRAVAGARASDAAQHRGRSTASSPHYPRGRPGRRERGAASDGYVNRWFLDPVLQGLVPGRHAGASTRS